MKEYLVKDEQDSSWFYTVNPNLYSGNSIGIPDGAEVLTIKNGKNFVFWKNGLKKCIGHDDDWVETSFTANEYIEEHGDKGAIIAWKRADILIDDSVVDAKYLPEDKVNQPSHYAKGGVECIDAIESSMSKDAFLGYLKGNIQKYIWRYECKGGLESLLKAQWYLNRLIGTIECSKVKNLED